MNHKRSALLLILIVAIGVYGFYALFEPYEKLEDLGWDRTALRNPYLAAELFLRRLNVDVQSYDRFDKLDSLPENGTIFVSNSRHVLSAKRVHALHEWIKRGGHLIVAASAPMDGETDRLLASFAIDNRAVNGNSGADKRQDHRPSVVSTDAEGVGRPRERSESLPQDHDNHVESDRAIATGRAEDEGGAPLSDTLTRLRFNGIRLALTLQFLPSRTLYHPAIGQQHQRPLTGYAPIYWAGDGQGVHFIQLEVGHGLLSVLSDGALWQSDQIDKFDHAFFLRMLARDGNGVRLLYGVRMPSLLTLIWRHASPLIIASAFWLVAWLYYRGRRFGPIVQQQNTTRRRSMAEHILASANYLWRGGWITPLLTPVRDDIERHARRAVPNYEQFDPHTQYQCLSMYSGINLARVEDAMRRPGKQHEDHFVETIQCLQQIRKSL
jgi:hypothetical protein